MSRFDGLSLKERIALGAEDIAKHRALYEAEFHMENLPSEVQQLVWNKAWEDGHSSGFDEVRWHYMDAAQIAVAAWNTRAAPTVKPLVWEQIDPVTCGATSVFGMAYTVWAMDGFGYCKFPDSHAGERFAGGSEEAKAAAQAHNNAYALSAWGGAT